MDQKISDNFWKFMIKNEDKALNPEIPDFVIQGIQKSWAEPLENKGKQNQPLYSRKTFQFFYYDFYV